MERQLEYLRSRNASKEVPYVIQEVLQNPEFGSYALFNKGALTGFEFFESAGSCLVYRQNRGKDFDEVLELTRGLGKAMNLTGQLTLDLMYTATGNMVPIECNPRIHSAVCTLEGHRLLGAAFTDADHVPEGGDEVVTSHPDTFRFWIMDQLFLKAGFGSQRIALSSVLVKCSREQMPSFAATILSHSLQCILCRSHHSWCWRSSRERLGSSWIFA